MIIVRQLKLPINHGEADLYNQISKALNLKYVFRKRTVPEFTYSLLRKSIDARKKPDLFYIYAVKVSMNPEAENLIRKYCNSNPSKTKDIVFEEPVQYKIPEKGDCVLDKRPVIIGSGPAGLFAAYILAKSGYKPIVIERGMAVEDRIECVNRIWNSGVVDTKCNVQFGEGGAGTFSDGKLNTLTKDSTGMHSFVLDTFASFGAGDEVRYDAKPHVGTDKLVDFVINIRNEIKSLGGDFYFDTLMSNLIVNNGKITGLTLIGKEGEYSIDTDVVILAIGHSARDTFEMLNNMGVCMNSKDFALGFRLQHPQKDINLSQYGREEVPELGPADYKVAYTTTNNRRVYSFCMCPGGYVVNASSEEGMLCVNGMSYSKRDSKYANSAIVIAIEPQDYHNDDSNPLCGMYYQRELEKRAYTLGGSFGCIPAQRFEDFEKDTASCDFNEVKPCTKGMVMPANLRELFSEEINSAVVEAIHKFAGSIKGFDNPDAIMYGVESRTSSPVRINRDEKFEGSIEGLYPCGEGAGYAGGITSAAVDGIKVAGAVISKYCPTYK